MKKNNVIGYLGLIIIVSSLFVLKTSYFQGHDLDFHLSRIISIKDCITMKKICYVSPNYLNGYGYGTPLFYPELFLLIPSLLLYFGLSLTTSYKIFVFLINAFSILNMYFCVKKITNSRENGLLSSFLYAFTSYRVIDLTTRGALGEALSFVFFPFVILGIYEIIYGDYKNYKYLIIGMSGIMLSHLLSSVIIFVYLVIFCLVNIKTLFNDKNRIKYLVISALVTFLLTSYFILPMLEQLSNDTYNLNYESTVLMNRAMPIHHIFLESAFTQIIDGNKWIWSPGTVGTVLLIIIFLYLITIFRKEKYSKFIKQNMIISLIFIFLTTRLFPWQIFQHIFYIIQFPWRLNIIPAILLPIIGCFVVSKFRENKNLVLLIIVVMGLFSIQSITVFKDVHYVDKNKYNDYEIMFAEYLPISINNTYIKSRNDIVSNNKNLDYTYTKDDNILTIDFKNNDRNTILELPFIYYKGYSTYIDNKKIDTFESVNGLVSTTIDEDYENGTIQVYYKGTFIQKLTRCISIITLVICMLFNGKILKIK